MTTPKLSAALLTAGLFGLLIAMTGCSKPAVQFGSIDGRVRSIENWTIEWHGQTEPVPEAPISGLSDTRSKYTLPQYCLKYIDEVRRSLSRQHGFAFYDNVPATGRLVVALYGARVTRAGIAKTDAERLMDELTGDWPDDGTVESAVREEGFDWGKADIVKKVEVKAYDIEGKLMAHIFIGGNPDDKVKPSFVADAISKAFQK